MKKITEKNRMMLYKGLILLVLALFSSCSEKKEKMYREEITGLFDTTHILVGYDKNEKDFKEKWKYIKRRWKDTISFILYMKILTE